MLFIIIAALLLVATLVALTYMPNPERKVVGPILAVVLVGWIGFNSFTIVKPGETAVPIVLGSVDLNVTYSEGVNWVNPMATIEEYDTKRLTVNYSGENALAVLSKDRVKLTVDATMTFRTNPAYIGIIRQQLGNGHIDALVIPASRAAFRSASSQFNWVDAAIMKRTEFADAITSAFQQALNSDLIANGIDKKIAPKMYTVGKVQLRNVSPPAKISTAIAERLSAEERLKKQAVLTKIAAEEALRRSEEGNGIANLLNAALGKKIGSSYDPQAVRIVLSAIADKTRADAMEAAVESGKVTVMVMGGSASVAVPVQ